MSTPAAAASADPFQALTAAKDADLLVMGIRGRSPLAGLLLGSTSQIAAAAAPCPVVLVRKEDFPAD